jgi:hypothetical protein
VKLQIIHLDPEDDHLSARDKIGWPNASHVILVWPRRGRILHRKLDLVILQRFAAHRSFHLGLVTFDPEVERHARAVKIPVFESLDEISLSDWPSSPSLKLPKRGDRPELESFERFSKGQRNEKTTHKWTPIRRLVPIVLGFASVGLLLTTVLPSVDITLYPQTWRQPNRFDLQVDPSLDEPQGDSRIPAQQVTILVEGEASSATSGVIQVPTGFAEGEVTFTNLTDQTQLIPAGTRVRPSGNAELKFETNQTIRLAAGIDQQRTVSITALEPGLRGNLSSHQIDSIEGELGFLVKVDNPSPIAGGENSRVASPTQQDLNDLQVSLTGSLVERAIDALLQSLESDQALFRESVQTVRIISIDTQPRIGEPASQFRVQLVLEVEAFVYRKSDLATEIQLLLAESLPSDSEAIPDTMEWEVLSSPAFETVVESRLTVEADQALYRKQDLREITRYLPRLDVEAADRFLKSIIPLDANPVIDLYPAWFPTMPWFESQIHLHWHWEESS